MTPATRTMVEMVIRHVKGVVKAVETWLEATPTS